ncbi:hypothetical protein GJ496_011104 [Pomphorhynchus laevis]|nr:hypothetical protein GJ496_011104 [Pomphorhynchus laevis]
MQPYSCRRSELSTEGAIVLLGARVVIPSTLRKDVLRVLHAGHPGIVSMETLSRFYVWWPKIDSDIENYMQQCEYCQQYRNNEPNHPLHSWSIPSQSWTRIHVEFAGPSNSEYYIVIVCALTKLPELLIDVSASGHTIKALLGTGSSSNFIDPATVRKLSLNTEDCLVKVSMVHSAHSSVFNKTYDRTLNNDDNAARMVEFNVNYTANDPIRPNTDISDNLPKHVNQVFPESELIDISISTGQDIPFSHKDKDERGGDGYKSEVCAKHCVTVSSWVSTQHLVRSPDLDDNLTNKNEIMRQQNEVRKDNVLSKS